MHGTSDAALCLGYENRGEDENLFDEIVSDLSAELGGASPILLC